MNTTPNSQDMTFDPINNFQFSDIFDIADIQHMQDLFADATGVASIITLPDGTPITKPSNFCRLCNDIIRKTDIGLRNCMKSDALLGSLSSSNINIQHCLSGGLWDAATNITVGGTHIANWLIGQVRNDELNEKQVLLYADEIGADKADYIAALNEVPVMSAKQFAKVTEMLLAFTKEISDKAYTNYQLKIQIAEREKATALLAENEARFRNLLQDVQYVSVQGYGPDGTTQYWNKASESIYGYSSKEAVGKNLIDLIIPPEMKEQVKQGIKYMAETGQPIPASELLLQRKDNSRVPVYSTHTIIQLPGLPMELFCIDIDLTERKQSEFELQQSEEKFRNVFEHSVEGKSLTTIDGRLQTNKAFCEMLGYAEGELSDINWRQITHPDDIKKNEDVIASILSGENTTVRWEKRYIHKKGNIVWTDISITLQRNSEGSPLYFITAINDITDRKHAEETLYTERQLLRALIDNIPDCIYTKDLAGRKTLANLAELSFMRAKSEEEVLGKDDFDIYPLEFAQRFYEDDQLVLQSGKAVLNKEGFILDGKGHKRWMLSSKLPLRGKDNKIIGILGIGHDITERKKVEETIRESEEKYRLIFENSPLGLLSFDESGIIIACNNSFVQIVGSTREKLIGLNMLNLPDKNMVATVKKALNGDTALYEDLYHSVTANKISMISALFAPMEIGDGHIRGGVGIIEDITERRHTMEELANQKYFFEQMFTQSTVSTQILDSEGWCEKVNPKLSELFGIKPQHIEGKLYNIFKDEANRQNGIIPFLENVFKDGKTAEWEVFYDIGVAADSQKIEVKEKKKVWFYNWAYPIFNKAGVLSNVIIQHEDITERKKAEHEFVKARINAEESEYKVRSMFENSLTGYVFFTSQGKVLEANPAAIKILGSPSLEATKQINSLTYQPLIDNGFSQEFVKCIEENKVITNELIYESGWGKKSYIKYFLIPIIYFDEIIGVWANLQDLTDLWQTQNDLMAAKEHAEESDRLKSAFLANMSHEIRTPMNGILGFAELLKTPDLAGEVQQEYIRIIKKSGDRMLNIINDIVDISKIESGQMKVSVSETRINEQTEFIQTFFKPEAEKKGLTLKCTNGLPSKESVITTDKEKIYAILTNLVKNAIKYTNRGSIEFGYTLKTGSEHPNLEFYVRDTGIGVARDRQKAIFERFIQADIADKQATQGAGLGLSITKAYIEMLGGKIWIESTEGEGSTFYFTIPYHPQQETKSEGNDNTPVENATSQIKKLKILIVEDDETSELLVSMAVRTISKEILKSRTGNEAVETCLNNPDIDLVLMDIKIPGLDGFEATRQIRKSNKKVVIIAQTAFGLSGDREKTIEAGCDDYISKPISKALLNEIIRKHFKDKKDS